MPKCNPASLEFLDTAPCIEINTVDLPATPEEILKAAEQGAKQLKKDSLDYVDRILEDMQSKMDKLNATYVDELYAALQKNFDQINMTLAQNRTEVKNMMYSNNTQTEVKEVIEENA